MHDNTQTTGEIYPKLPQITTMDGFHGEPIAMDNAAPPIASGDATRATAGGGSPIMVKPTTQPPVW